MLSHNVLHTATCSLFVLLWHAMLLEEANTPATCILSQDLIGSASKTPLGKVRGDDQLRVSPWRWHHPLETAWSLNTRASVRAQDRHREGDVEARVYVRLSQPTASTAALFLQHSRWPGSDFHYSD